MTLGYKRKQKGPISTCCGFVVILPPIFTTSPTISGVFSIGSLLTCTPGTWTGTEPITPTYQWQRDGVALVGETAATYVLLEVDMLATITCTVTITNSAGSDTETSNGLSWADYIATLNTRTWLDAQGGTYLSLSGTLIDTALDRSGSGNNASASGAARPAYDATAIGGRGAMLFSGAQALSTPPFSMGARQSGCVVWRPTGDNQAALEFGAFEQHGYVFCSGGALRVRRSPAGGEVGRATGYPVLSRITWRSSPAGIRAIFNGVVVTAGAAGVPTPLVAPLYVGALVSGTFFHLIGNIGELVFADALWTDAEMSAVDAALAARWA